MIDKARMITGHYKIDKHDEHGNHIATFEGANVLTDAGVVELLRFLGGLSAPGTAFGVATQIGVADGSTAALHTDADVQSAGANKAYQVVSGAPTQNNAYPESLAWVAIFASGAANFPWNNMGVFNGSMPGATMLSHIQGTYGTKVAGQVWTVTYTIQIS